MKNLFFVSLILFVWSCQTKPYDIIIRNGTLYDGSGGPPVVTDVGINSDTIAFIGDLSKAKSRSTIDAAGLAVAPGFINMLSWATTTLIMDGRSMSDIKQGVTLEVFGEGWSMGPLNEEMKETLRIRMDEFHYDIDWTTLGEYLQSLERRKISCNVASFLGATTVRIHELGYEDRLPTAEEMERMKAHVRLAMEEGALGIGSSLIYAPASYSSTEELIELCKEAAKYGGMYITHMRSEGDNIFAAIDETMRIAREAGIPAEIYHLKLGGKDNWDKIDSVIRKIEDARKQGIKITTNMYTYTAGATGLDASMPTWVQEGGLHTWIKRLRDPKTRERVIKEMRTKSSTWENLLLMADSAENVLLVGFRNDSLKTFTGKTLAEVARRYGKSPEETAMDLVIADSSRVETVYFMMSEDNVRKQITLPFMSFGSDAGSYTAEGMFLTQHPHPRSYGNFARLLGKYVRDEKLITLSEAIRKLTSLPAENLKIKSRGRVLPGYYADVVVFDANAIADKATFEEPHQYAEGMVHVFVNGVQVLNNGEHTGSFPGRVVKRFGPMGLNAFNMNN